MFVSYFSFGWSRQNSRLGVCCYSECHHRKSSRRETDHALFSNSNKVNEDPFLKFPRLIYIFLQFCIFNHCIPKTIYQRSINIWEQFSIVLRRIQDYLGFSWLCSVIVPENYLHPLNQSDAKLRTMAYRSFSVVIVFTLSSHWLMMI